MADFLESTLRFADRDVPRDRDRPVYFGKQSVGERALERLLATLAGRSKNPLQGANRVLFDWTYLLLILPGLFVGFLAFSRISHLLQAFIKPEANSDTVRTPDASLTRVEAIGALAFAVCWLGLFGGLAYYLLTERGSSPGWSWFFVGIAATPIIIFPATLLLLDRARRRRAEYVKRANSIRQDSGTFDYEITFSESYIRTLISRYLRQSPFGHPLTLSILFTVAAVVIYVFDLVGWESSILAAIVFVMGILGNIFAYYMSRRVLFSDFGYASHMGKTSIYRVSANGLEVEGPRPCHETIWPDLIEWPNILRAARFRDGMLLCGFGGKTENYAIAWLPYSALRDANPLNAARFIEENMRPRTVKKLK